MQGSGGTDSRLILVVLHVPRKARPLALLHLDPRRHRHSLHRMSYYTALNILDFLLRLSVQCRTMQAELRFRLFC
jgi:hypothetical protein